MQRGLDRGTHIGGPPQRIYGSAPYVLQRLQQNAVAVPLLEPAHTCLRFVPDPLEQVTEVALVRFDGVVYAGQINLAARARDRAACRHLSAKSLEVSVVQQQCRGQLGPVVPRPVAVLIERLPNRAEVGAPLFQIGVGQCCVQVLHC